jgi:hypothetical protein
VTAAGTLERVLAEFGELLSLVGSAFESGAALTKLLRSFGIAPTSQLGADLSALGAAVTAVGDLRTALDTLAETGAERDLELDDYLPLTGKIAAVALALGQLPDHLRDMLGNPASVPDTLYTELVDLLVATYLLMHHETTYRVLVMLGIIVATPTPAGSGLPHSRDLDYVRFEIMWPRLELLITNPKQLGADVYQWGTPDFEFNLLLTRLASLFESLDVQAAVGDLDDTETALDPGTLTDATPRPQLRVPIFANDDEQGFAEAGLALVPSRAQAPAGAVDFGIALVPFVDGNVTVTIALTDTVSLTITGAADIQGGIALSIRPTAGFTVDGLGAPPSLAAKVGLKVTKSPPAGATTVRLLGSADSTRLEAQALFAAIAATLHSVDISAGADGGALVIQAGDGDGFLAKVLPKDPLRVDFDILVGWSSLKGLYFSGGAGLEVTVPVHQTLFDVFTIDELYLAIAAAAGKFDAVIAVTAHLAMGPFKASVSRIGIKGELSFPAGGGNLGPAELALAFKPPDGAGMSIDASAVTGGGFLSFDTEKEQYAGILYLEVKDKFAIKVIGILTTRLPGGEKGFSLLLIITAEFPPIQLGYGFALAGVGGLIGVNRTMMLAPLRDGIKNHTLDSVLFPENPIVNAPRIISDLKTIFPPAENRFVFGPMAKVIWGGAYPLLSVELGIILEVPAPIRLALLGKITLALPKPDEPDDPVLVYICMEIIGTADFDKGEVSIDGVLVDSRIVVFSLTGGMALRLRWGSDPFFAVAIGGFNPHFTVPPGFPVLDRLAIGLSYDKSGVKARLGFATYLALTTNTFQMGARIDAYAEFSGARLYGYLGFDALVEFQPFHLVVDLYGGVGVKAFGFDFSVDLLLTLSGPAPWLGDGHVTVNFLGKHEFPIHFSIGDAVESPPLPPVDAAAALAAALGDPHNWSAALPAGSGMLVTLRAVAAGAADQVLAHPLGDLAVRQSVLPLGIALERLGAARPTAPGPFDISTFHVGTAAIPFQATAELRDSFAPGQYLDLTDDEKLTRPAFEPFRCGQTRVGIDPANGAVATGASRAAAFEYDVTVIDAKDERRSRTSRNPADGIVAGALSDVAMLRAGQYGAPRGTLGQAVDSSRYAGAKQGIVVRGAGYRVASTDDLTARDSDVFATYTEADAARPRGSAGTWQVVDAHEAG